jgi:hypothetical protein
MPKEAWRVHCAEVARASKAGDHETEQRARTKMEKALFEQRLTQLIESAPPVSAALSARIAALLTAPSEGGGDAA